MYLTYGIVMELTVRHYYFKNTVMRL